MAVSPRLGTFEEKLHQILSAQLREQAAKLDVHHTRRLPFLVIPCCKETKKRMRLLLAVAPCQTALISED